MNIPFEQDLKLVKNAKLNNESGIFEIIHYGTTIFSHDKNNGITHINYDCSVTSNKQINYALDYLGIKKSDCVNMHKGDKNNFSGDQS